MIERKCQRRQNGEKMMLTAVALRATGSSLPFEQITCRINASVRGQRQCCDPEVKYLIFSN
jgi:hypothetical protein